MITAIFGNDISNFGASMFFFKAHNFGWRYAMLPIKVATCSYIVFPGSMTIFQPLI